MLRLKGRVGGWGVSNAFFFRLAEEELELELLELELAWWFGLSGPLKIDRYLKAAKEANKMKRRY